MSYAAVPYNKPLLPPASQEEFIFQFATTHQVAICFHSRTKNVLYNGSDHSRGWRVPMLKDEDILEEREREKQKFYP